MIKMTDLYAQYLTIKPEIDAAIQSVIKDSAFIGGQYVIEFERRFSEYQSSEYCVGVGNGTDGLEIALEALNLPMGSEVIVPANSFIATAEAVTRSGHRIVFADVSPETYTLDVEDVSRRITKNTAAIVAVHLYGQACEIDSLAELAAGHGLRLVEDCAQAHGAEYKGRRVGSIGDIGVFSFYPGKILGAYGDGGAILTNDKELANKCRMIANHGRVDKYNHEFEGRNSRLDGLQAAILTVKLNYLDAWIAKRNELANRYINALAGMPEVILPVVMPQVRHVFHLFVIRTRSRAKLIDYLAGRGIETGIHYPLALPKQSAFAYLGQAEEAMAANNLDSELLSLPLGEHTSDSDVDNVVQAIRGALIESPLQ